MAPPIARLELSFILAGTARAGTTALWDALVQNDPNIVAPTTKELNYFNQCGLGAQAGALVLVAVSAAHSEPKSAHGRRLVHVMPLPGVGVARRAIFVSARFQQCATRWSASARHYLMCVRNERAQRPTKQAVTLPPLAAPPRGRAAPNCSLRRDGAARALCNLLRERVGDMPLLERRAAEHAAQGQPARLLPFDRGVALRARHRAVGENARRRERPRRAQGRPAARAAGGRCRTSPPSSARATRTWRGSAARRRGRRRGGGRAATSRCCRSWRSGWRRSSRRTGRGFRTLVGRERIATTS